MSVKTGKPSTGKAASKSKPAAEKTFQELVNLLSEGMLLECFCHGLNLFILT